MASIDRTAYPRFQTTLSAPELQTLYAPTEAERAFVATHATAGSPQLTLLTLLKCQQSLGYLPALDAIPLYVRQYLSQQLQVPPATAFQDTKHARARYRQLIRRYVEVRAYAEGGATLVQQTVTQAAYTMSDPADLINVAIEQLIAHRFELPAFQTLDHTVTQIRARVHQDLYRRMTTALGPAEQARLEALLHVQAGRSEFNRLKDTPRRATLTHVRQWTERLTWLNGILMPQPFLHDIASTKVQQFAAEAAALDVGDLRAIRDTPRRVSLLLCLLHRAHVQTRDQLAEMVLKRMRATTNAAHERLTELHAQHRELEEHMLAVFSEVLDHTIETPAEEEATLGHRVRHVLKAHGGAEALRERYTQVAAYHSDNYRPLMWAFFRPYRAALFQVTRLLTLRSATHDQSLLDALRFVQQHQHVRGSTVPNAIALDFASTRWQALILTRRQRETVLQRRPLEVCVFFYLDHGLRCGDIYIEGSDTYADYRQQLLSREECVTRLPAYCQALQLPTTAADFVTALRTRLREAAQRVDDAYPSNPALTIDAEGTPHLKRLPAHPIPAEFSTLERLLKARLPERHLLDVLKNVQAWVGYTHHFGPPSGAAPKLTEPVLHYLFTVFSYACELGATQTARHADGLVSRQVLRRLNAQHITAPKLEAALREVIATYMRFELPHLWGSGRAAIADGTHIGLRENNLLGAQHIRYGRFGGIAYRHISDTYIALFSHFIACGVWEAVYILDGLLKNRSVLQPDTVYADTHGQTEPVFGLAALLGITLMPRMRTWNDVTFYRVDPTTTYTHIDALFTQVVDWDLIERHWPDMMQVVLSIQAGKVLPSMLLQKLGVYSRQSSLYKAFSELGRVERTLFLLTYMTDPTMRQQIRAETTKVESYHAFADWMAFGGPVLRTADPVEQEKRMKYRDLVANAIMLHNVVDMTNVLSALQQEGVQITPELARYLSPYLTEHLKRFGRYVLDMATPAEPFTLRSLFGENA